MAKSFLFAALSYGIALLVCFLVVAIIRVTYYALRRGENRRNKAEPGQ